MKVIYAVQILSRTNAKNLQRYAKECADGDNSSAKLNALADYCLLCNSFFDLLNGCHESTLVRLFYITYHVDINVKILLYCL